jgi:hypothetical protein
MPGWMRSPRGALLSKIAVASLGCWAIWVLRGPWWYIAVYLAGMGLIIVDAIRAYRRPTRSPD